ncbi:acetyl-CoA carboxylase biotin carboxyl carrier protein, partial [Sutterella sp.]
AAAPAPAPAPASLSITSPMVGTFYRAPSPGAAPFIEVGDQVKKGQVIGIIEAMKLLNEVEADKDGVVKAFAAENGQPVEYGQPLVILE